MSVEQWWNDTDKGEIGGAEELVVRPQLCDKPETLCCYFIQRVHSKAPLYNLSKTERFYCVISYLTEKLSKLHSFDTQWRRPQNCPFQSSFTQRTAQFTHVIPQFPQFTCRHHDGIISRHIRF